MDAIPPSPAHWERRVGQGHRIQRLGLILPSFLLSSSVVHLFACLPPPSTGGTEALSQDTGNQSASGTSLSRDSTQRLHSALFRKIPAFQQRGVLSWITHTSDYDQVFLWGFTHGLDEPGHADHFPGWVSLMGEGRTLPHSLL